MVVRLICVAALSILAACQTTGGNFCDIARAQRPTQSEIAAMTDARVAQVLAHNEKGRKLCGWKA